MSSKVKFLYDEQLNNPATTIRIYNTDKNSELVAKAFYQDDFHMSITNQWSTGDGTLLKTLVDSASSVVTGRSGKLYSELAMKGLDWASEGAGKEGKALADSARNVVKIAQQYQNASFFTADDFFKSFKGTTVTFPLNLQLTLVSDEMFPKEDIYDKLKKILDVSVGDYDSTLWNWVGIQFAPNGFQSGSFDLTDTSKALDGTLRISYGDPLQGGYTLQNMLISNVHCTFSKTKVKINSSTWRPLYIDVQIMLEPGKKFMKTDIARSLGIPNKSFGRRGNFENSNGESDKETSSRLIERQKELDAVKAARAKKTIKENLSSDMEPFDISNSKVDGDTLRIVSTLRRGEAGPFRDKVTELDLENYPGVSKVSYDINYID